LENKKNFKNVKRDQNKKKRKKRFLHLCHQQQRRARRLTGRRVGRRGGQVGQSAGVVRASCASAGRVLSAAAGQRRRRASTRARLGVRRVDVVRTDVLVPRSVHRLHRHTTDHPRRTPNSR